VSDAHHDGDSSKRKVSTQDLTLAILIESISDPSEAPESNVISYIVGKNFPEKDVKGAIRMAKKLGLIERLKTGKEWILRIVDNGRKIKSYNKLVRDKIPTIIKKRGGKAVIRIASRPEYFEKLKEKLLEEAGECAQNPTVEELADVLEVIEAIQEHLGISLRKLRAAKSAKARLRGKFKERIILVEVNK